jgi:exopolysaccharide biosynthesis polyprenyl glycosylphosphotransferase
MNSADLSSTLGGASLHPGAQSASDGPLPNALVPHADDVGGDAVNELLRREQTYRRLLAASDACAVLLTLLTVARIHGVRIGWLGPLVPFFGIAVAKVQGLYDRDDMVIQKSTLSEWRSVFQAAAMTAIGIYLVWPQLTSASNRVGMRLFALLILCEFVLCLLLRMVARRLARRLTPDERCLIVGEPMRCRALAEKINAAHGVQLLGSVPGSELDRPLADLQQLVGRLRIHRLVIVPGADTSDADTLQLVREAKWIGLRVSLFPTLLAAVGGCTVFDELDGMTLLGVPRFGLSKSSRLVKRTFDFLLSIIGLILLSPLLAVIAVLVKLDSRGPSLFIQARVGQDGRHFRMLKFRTMVPGAEAMKRDLVALNEAGAGLFKISNDPRITRFGRRLRKAHLDELPQLWNVLRGEMSLVGPRPLIEEEDQQLAGGDRYRLKLTPGMTGPWQVRGPINTPLSEMAKLDYLYISNWSLWQDIDILLQTATRVIARGGH